MRGQGHVYMCMLGSQGEAVVEQEVNVGEQRCCLWGFASLLPLPLWNIRLCSFGDSHQGHHGGHHCLYFL